MPSPLRRRIRHARRAIAYGGLVVLILLATAVGALNQLLPLVERNPEQVADWLSRRVGQPVAFDGARGEWTRRGPRFTLEGLRIGEGGRRLDIGHAELLVAVYTGWWPGEPLTALKVRDLSLVLEQGEDRRWRLAGLPFEPQPGVDPLDTLQALGELQVERARLEVRSPALEAPLAMPRVDLRLRVSGEHVLAGVRAWADPSGQPLSAVADLARADWSGRLWAGGRRLDLSQWSRLLADTGLVVAGRGEVDLWARIEAQRVMDVRSRAEFAPLALGARRAWLPVEGGEPTSPPVAYERANLLARWQAEEGGWQLHAPELHFHEVGRAEPRRLDGLWLAGGRRFALEAPRIDLGPARQLATLSDRVPLGLRQWLLRAAPEGELRHLRVEGGDGRWSGGAAFHDVRWLPYENRPGLDGLNGNAAFDQDGGVLSLQPAPGLFRWPGRFREDLPVRLEGQLGWWREGGSWSLGAAGLRVRGQDFGAQLRAELHFEGDGSRPRLDLAATVDPTTVAAARHFWVVGKMPENTIRWLDEALVEGAVLEGRVSLAGDLDDWPFRDGEGVFDARAHVTGARVRFNPDWPDAEQMDLQVSFDGPGMALEGSGAIAGNPVGRVAGGIADFREPRLRLDVDSESRAEDLRALLLASPVKATHGEHLDAISAEGPATVALLLDLPLSPRAGGGRRIEGSVRLDRARLADPRWDVAFSEASGLARFSAGGFYTEDLDVVFEGHPAVFNLAVGDDTDDPALAARARLQGEFPAAALLARHPPLAWLQPRLRGAARWDVQVDVPEPVRGTPTVARLRVDSDLAGIAVDLPAPLGKEAGLGLPLRLDAPLPVSAGEVQLRWGELMRLRGRVGEDGGLTGVIRMGEGGSLAMPARGLVVQGRAPTLDAAGWIGFAAGDGEGAGEAGGVREVDLQVGSLDLLGSPFADTRVRLLRQPGATVLTLDGAAIAGEVRVPEAEGAAVLGRFARLHWPEKAMTGGEPGLDGGTPDSAAASPGATAGGTPATAASNPEGAALGTPGDALAALPEGAPAEAPGQDPTRLPPLDFRAEDLRIGSLVLGAAELQASRAANGLRIDRFQTRSPGLRLDAQGDWERTPEGRSRSRFVVDFNARALGDLLGAFGLAGMVEDGPTQGRLDGDWAGSPGEFSLARFNGRFKVEVGEGALLEVEPGGGGRVLGLISLAEIPRRLTLDFSDFFAKGFGFNSMAGEFVFRDGRASTDLLAINGPAAEIRVSGSTDLRAQTYDQRIEVLPKAGGVLPAIGAIAGGPVGAAVGAVAQAVLQQPLKQAARTVYRVTGPWREPVVEVVEKGPPAAPPPVRQP